MKESPVFASDDGIRLDRWFQRHHPHISHSHLQKMLRKKLIRLDGKRVEANERIRQGQVIKHPEFTDIPESRPQKPIQKPDWLDDAVLYQDKNVIILNKPAGLPTQGGSKQTTHLDRLLPLLQGDAEGPPKLVHRLDKDTSGVLVLARHANAADKLMKAFAAREIEKRYLALCVNVPPLNRDEITTHIKLPIGKRVYGGEEKMTVAQDGKSAHTEYRVIEKLAQRYSLVELMPHTGRKHQLRVHLAHLECPIIGDGKYGGEKAFPEGLQIPKKMHLHARQITLPSSLFGKEVTVSAPLPEHFRKSFDRLEIQWREK
jgi:23S rRNA pseudouridine955/2504/2580 synthase